MVIIMMKARHSPLALSSQRRRKGYPRLLMRTRAAMCTFSRSNNASILPQHGQIHNESFYTVWCRTAQSPASLGSRQPGGRHVYIIGKWSSSTNRRLEWARLTSRGSYCWQMHDAQSPPTPSLHLHAARTKGMGTSDWPLPRVTAIARAGGAARCSSAVAMAADKLLSWGVLCAPPQWASRSWM